MARKGDFYPFNDYKVEDDVAKIFFTNTKREKFEILVDLDILNYLKKINHHWRASYRKKADSYYAQTILHDEYLIGYYKTKTPYLHKMILEAETKKDQYIHHINHNTLDNRRVNLEITSNKNNSMDRNGQNSNNKSGYRNVCWDKNSKIWVVQIQLNGVNTRLGKFEDVKQAGKFAEDMRLKYYGKYRGTSNKFKHYNYTKIILEE
ncbi:AP2 domain-containing protein [Paenibacillus xylanexedens]|uniref:AP2 domain-containing protein n=1 Tax=Paenibacillus xylanexedens TaxID=528191 RepID=UPI000F548134|nr:AP2 domain-containing protein [Paenibacillus xylanexedens]